MRKPGERATATAQSLSTAFVMVAIAVIPIGLVLRFGGSGWFEFWRVRLIYDTLAIVAIGSWLLFAMVRREWLPVTRLVPAIVAVLGIFALTSITSRNPRLSMEMAAYVFLLVELYLLLVALMRRPRYRAQFERVVLALAFLVCILYLLEVLQAWLLWWDTVGRLTIPPLRPGYLGLSLGPNPLATLVMILGALGLASGRLRGPRGRAAEIVLLVLIVLTVVISGSRGAWLGAAVGIVVCGLATVVLIPETRSNSAAVARTRAGIVTILVVGTGLTTAFVVAGISGRLTLADDGYRGPFVAASLRMFASSPLVGVGPALWPVLRASFTPATDPDGYFPHAHDIYVQAIAEFGLLAVVAGVVVAVSLGGLVIQALRSHERQRRRVALATLFTVTLLASQQLFDMLMNVPALLFALALPVAWLDAAALGDVRLTGDPTEEHRPARIGLRSDVRPALVVGMMTITLAVGVGLFRIEAIASDAEHGIVAANAGDWSTAGRYATEAAADDPAINAYLLSAGIAAANSGNLNSASDLLSRSAAGDDYPIAWLDLAAVRWRLGDREGAKHALDRAERLGLQQAPVALAAGWLRLQLGDHQQAVDELAIAVRAEPTILSDPFWSSDPHLRAARTAIEQRLDAWAEAPATSPAALAIPRFRLALYTDDLAAAEAALEAMDASSRPLYDTILAAWQGLDSAESTLREMAAENSRDLNLVGWCRFIAAEHGDEPAVARYDAWLSLANSPPLVAPVARVTFDPTRSESSIGLQHYGSLYRRSLPNARIILGLPQLEYQDHP